MSFNKLNGLEPFYEINNYQVYNTTTKQLTTEWGNWLGSTNWNYFSTITYRFDINPRRNEKLMLELEKYLISLLNKFKLFWVMELTVNGYQTHNHLLIKGEGVERHVEQFLEDKKLIHKKCIKHIPYKSSLGANYYVTKYINSPTINYGIAYSKHYSSTENTDSTVKQKGLNNGSK